MSDELEKRVPSKEESLDFTSRFREAFDRFCDSAEEVAKFLKESLEIDYWSGAEYDDWKDWYETEYADHISFLKDVKLGIDTRADIVQSLAEGGLSNRQIAGTLGVNEKTIRLDLRKIGQGAENSASNEVDTEETAGQSVEPVGHIDDDSESLQTVTMNETKREEEVPQIQEDNKDEEPAEEVDRFGGINFDALILPTPNQIVEAEPTPDTADYFVPRSVAPSWSPPQVQPLPSPPPKRYDDDQPEFLAPPMKLEKPRDPNKDETKHCRTCNCNLLP